MKLNKIFSVFLICALMVFSEFSFAKGMSSSSSRSFSSSSSMRSSSSSSMRTSSNTQSKSNAFSSSNKNNYANTSKPVVVTGVASKPTNTVVVPSKPVVVSSGVKKPETSNSNFTVIGGSSGMKQTKTITEKPVNAVVYKNKDDYYNRNIDNSRSSYSNVIPIYIPGSNVNGVTPVMVPTKKKEVIAVPKLKMNFISDRYCKDWICAIK